MATSRPNMLLIAGGIISGLFSIILTIMGYLMAGVMSEVGKIDVIESKIHQLQKNKEWMRKQQREIDELQRTVFSSNNYRVPAPSRRDGH